MELITLKKKIRKWQDIPLLLMRLVMGYGFYNAAIIKFTDIAGNAEWFKSVGIPLPVISTWISGGIELLGAILLVLGIFVRRISVLLIIMMIVAIGFVHITHGFEAMNDGFEINLYYIVMLLTLIIYGPGKYSLHGFF